MPENSRLVIPNLAPASAPYYLPRKSFTRKVEACGKYASQLGYQFGGREKIADVHGASRVPEVNVRPRIRFYR